MHVLDVPVPVEVLDRKRALRGMNGRSKQEKGYRKTRQFSAHGFSQSSVKVRVNSRIQSQSAFCLQLAREKKGRPALRRSSLGFSMEN